MDSEQTSTSNGRLHAGPQPQDRAARLQLIEELTNRLHSRYADQILLIAFYGSVARGQDGPYSDIELFCVLDVPDMDTSLEWVYGSGKAEINVLGRNDARWEAREVSEHWAIRQGVFRHAQLIYGDQTLLDELKDLVMAVTDDEINRTVSLAMVGELYEWIGKARNARATGEFGGIAPLACKFAEMVALLLGLANRTCYTTGARVLGESLNFEDLPAGYGGLCNLVQRGELADPHTVIAAMEKTWTGMVSWAMRRNVEIPVARWPHRQQNTAE